ncbi:MAG: phosphatase PAP2 family protein [Methylophilaceae bacterium]
MKYWQLITHLGSISLLLPTLIIALITLWQSKQKSTAFTWLTALSVVIALTVLSKILFMGWGVGIASLNFTGISGHTLLATSILPILFYSVIGKPKTKSKNIGLWIGLLLSILVGVSRFVLGMHSMSEVVAGWALGLLVCSIVLTTIHYHHQGYAYLQLTFLICLLGLGTATPNFIPSHSMETKLALYLSGHDKPYTRADLKIAKNQI